METLRSGDVYDDDSEDSTEYVHTQPLTGATSCLKVPWVRIPIAQMQKLRSRRVGSPRQNSDLLPSPRCCSCEPQSPRTDGAQTDPALHAPEGTPGLGR